MGATTTAPMTVAEARRRLQNTSNLSSEQVSDLRQVVDAFYAARPVARACLACRCMIWSEHTTDGNATWACANCHRPSTLTSDEWHAQQQAASAVRRAHDKTAAAAAPDPRAVLTEALAKLDAARKALSHIEAVLPASRSTLVAAQLKHDRAQEAAEAAAEQAAAHLADSIQGRRMAGPAPSIAATRAALATAVDGLVTAKNARAILDSRLTDARAAVGHANDRARKAAVRVIAAERLEPLLAETAEARATYLEGVSRLAWLIQQHAVPTSDARARQLVAGADTPPSSWREAASAGISAMGAAVTALMADPEAVL